VLFDRLRLLFVKHREFIAGFTLNPRQYIRFGMDCLCIAMLGFLIMSVMSQVVTVATADQSNVCRLNAIQTLSRDEPSEHCSLRPAGGDSMDYQRHPFHSWHLPVCPFRENPHHIDANAKAVSLRTDRGSSRFYNVVLFIHGVRFAGNDVACRSINASACRRLPRLRHRARLFSC
jgi:hypothetical protein